MKPSPLPPNPNLLDREEYALQWLVNLVVIDIPGRPCISGLCTGFLLVVPIIGVAIVAQILTGHWKL